MAKKVKIESENTENSEASYKVKSDLSFIDGKRNYFIGDKNVVLIEGETISNEDYELFNDRAKEMLFEPV